MFKNINMKKTLLLKKITRIVLTITPLLCAFTMNAQNNTNTPTYAFYKNATATFKVPFANTDTLFERSQVLYPPKHIKPMSGSGTVASGSITKVYFRADPKVTQTFNMKKVIIKLAQTTDTAWDNTKIDPAFYTVTEVFNQATYAVSTPGWIEFTLSKPFQYDNTKTLVVEVSGDAGFNCTYSSENSAGKAIAGKFNLAAGNHLPMWFEFGFSYATTSVGTIQNDTKVDVYPNPANSVVQISSDKSITGNVIIMDMSGRTVAQEKMNGSAHSLSVSNLANGLYFYKIVDAENTQIKTGKLTISH